ncbi:MAG: FimV/HubP family polar landmark protein [Candidatus Competibacteraceae bacterium]|nr:FimV/HubP family polar landmark protein [Candidatus Competibacteraceae bacterium]
MVRGTQPEPNPRPVVAVEPEPEPAPAVVEELDPEPAPVAQLQIELPVSATPLLLIAVSEMMASLTRIPTTLELKLMDPVLLAGSMDVNQTLPLNPSLQQGTAHCETPGCLAPYPLRGGGWGVRVANHESARALVEGVEWLVAIERRIPQAGFDWLALPGEPPWAKPVAGFLEDLDSVARAVEADRENVTAKAVDSATLVAKEGGQYGPVAPNERLWTIADKLRPDPSINTPTMMQALFVANPQAFSQGDMNFLKVDAILRIPTLREIVEYTGSRAAQQLLELDQQNQALPAPANGEEVGSE